MDRQPPGILCLLLQSGLAAHEACYPAIDLEFLFTFILNIPLPLSCVRSRFLDSMSFLGKAHPL